MSANIHAALERSRAVWRNRDPEHDMRMIGMLKLRDRLRSQFSMSMANLQSAHCYLCVRTMKTYYRSVMRSIDDARKAARGAPAVPEDAVYLNTYTHPVSSDLHLQDLQDAILCRTL